MTSNRPAEHGNRCSCRVLGAAIGCNPRAIRFSFCQAVLKKHWMIECNHGCYDTIAEPPADTAKWHDVGPIDAIKAILITNE